MMFGSLEGLGAMMKSHCSTVPVSTSSGELWDIGDGGRLTSLHGKADTTNFMYCWLCSGGSRNLERGVQGSGRSPQSRRRRSSAQDNTYRRAA